jgi:type II secretory pathway pseudopilin PulG
MVANPSRCEAGFTYVGLVVFVAILGMVGAATLKVDGLLRRAAAEQELLEIGAAFSAALRSYAAATPQGFAPVPPTLQDLLRDPRFPGTRRHLRKIFVDPVTGAAEWGIEYQGDKVGVLAVHSLSQAQPLKVANFDARFQHFENKEHLSEWKFTAGQGIPVAPPPGPDEPPPAPATASGL